MRRKPSQRSRIRQATRAVGVALAASALTVAAGCSGESHTAAGSTSATPTSTAPTSSPSSASNTSWNPCSIPDADIAATGLNPTKKQVGALGTKFPGWDICAWLSDSWYGLHVYSTSVHTFDEVVHNTTLFRDPQPVTVGGHAAVLLHHADNPKGCTIAFDIPQDPVQFEVTPKLSADQTGDSCSEVTRIANTLVKDLPAGK
ncbi:DUF3558 family protein [Nocardia terpenica]|uniref:DUF3558 domain-containing protein n=1 Tax=Nocardia terpenica TaxID=455432 RepID=A0A291RSP5_9NOCA|nr:DUF3558 family protein [Nocardia terpenica]ATL70254.1 hypothetical protein CRH09_32790 [Nocardia terpenica]